MFPSINSLKREYKPEEDRRKSSNHSGIRAAISLDDNLAFKKLSRLENIARIQIIILISYGVIVTLKNLVLVLLDLEIFAAYRYIDCYVLGRLQFVGRTGRVSKYIALTAAIAQLIYRYFLLLSKPKTRFSCVEFLLKGYDAALKNETRYENRRARSHDSDNDNNNIDDTSESYTKVPEYIDDIYCIENNFEFTTRSENVILRYNRTAESWIRMINFCNNLMIIYIINIPFWALFLFFILAPSVYTKVGFAFLYTNCISWIGQQNDRVQQEYSFILKPKYLNYSMLTIDDLPIVLPFSNFVDMNPYQMLRMVLDTFEDVYLYGDFIFSTASHTYLIGLVIYESHINNCMIRERLVGLAGDLVRLFDETSRRHDMHLGENRLSHSYEILPKGMITKMRKYDKKIQEQLIEIQEVLIDHYSSIFKYNNYVSFNASFIASLWMIHTMVLCLYIGMVGSVAIQGELYVIVVITGILSLMILGSLAIHRQDNQKLYTPISTLMALDHNVTVTKLRWISITKFFVPRPMYCFAIFGMTEFSWLFCLKVSVVILTTVNDLDMFISANNNKHLSCIVS